MGADPVDCDNIIVRLLVPVGQALSEEFWESYSINDDAGLAS